MHKRIRNYIFGMCTFAIIFSIFMVMDELAAQLVFFFGLSIIGLYLFRLHHLIFNKIYDIIKDIRLIDCGFWDSKGKYHPNYQLVNITKERIRYGKKESSKR